MNMAFSIGLLPEPVPDLDPGVIANYGQIKIGSFQERFIASLVYWDAAHYRCHWKQAVARIVHSSDISCLITSIVYPATAKYLFWWPMYRVRNTVYIQNQILFFDSLSSPLDEDNPFSFVTERRTVDEDGNAISEWSVSVDEMESFLLEESPPNDKRSSESRQR